METFPALLALCAGNSPVPGEFPAQRPVTRSSDVFSDLRLNKRLSKQSWGWWFETPSRPLWRYCNEIHHEQDSRYHSVTLLTMTHFLRIIVKTTNVNIPNRRKSVGFSQALQPIVFFVFVSWITTCSCTLIFFKNKRNIAKETKQKEDDMLICTTHAEYFRVNRVLFTPIFISTVDSF